MIKVVNCNHHSYNIYIGRGSIWGNPFVIGRDGNRQEVINRYRNYILKNKDLMDKIPTLKDKVLGCWCKPKACHGDVLKEIAENRIILTI